MKEENRKRKVLDFKCKHGDGWEGTAARRTKSLLLTTDMDADRSNDGFSQILKT